MKSFAENRPFIEDEFVVAQNEGLYDESTGLDPADMLEPLRDIRRRTDAPLPLLYAEGYAYLLDNVRLCINPHTPFSIKFNTGVPYREYAYDDVYHEAMLWRGKVLRDLMPEDYDFMMEGHFTGLGAIWTDHRHTVPDWKYVFDNGFAGILANARRSRAAHTGTDEQEQRDYLDAIIICYEAIMRLFERIIHYAEGRASQEFIDCMRSLTERAPRTLYEVMMTSMLYLSLEQIGEGRIRSLGNIDGLFLPYFRSDLAAGRTQEEICELFRYYFIRCTALRCAAQHPITLGGGDAEGRDRCNELTRLILDVYDEMGIYNPKIHFRYHKNIAPDVFRKVLSMIRDGHSSFSLINDESVFASYERIGIPREDAQHYLPIGCYEPVIMGLEEAEISATFFNAVKCIEYALWGGKDGITGKMMGCETPLELPTFEDFLDVFMKQLDFSLDFRIDFAEREGEYAMLVNPALIHSSSYEACIESGRDVHQYPLRYNNMSIKFCSIATVVDSLVAIKKFVYDQKSVTLDEMRDALRANWQGYEELRARILGDEDKYGNHLPLPDSLTRMIFEHLNERYVGKPLRRGGKLRIGLDSVETCIASGASTAATPDGRLCGTATSKNLCATIGMDRGGITALMGTVLTCITHLNAFVDAAPLDFVLHPSAVEGERGFAAFEALVRTFFANGGNTLQGNIVNAETLKDAQRHPEKYATLQIRVCGWNEYFVEMDKTWQDMFIRQCEGLSS